MFSILSSTTIVNAEEANETHKIKEIYTSSLLLDNGDIVPFGATGYINFAYGTTKTTLALRDSNNIPVKVEVWVERNTLTGANVKITKFSLLSYSGALISNVNWSVDSSKMNPGNGKTAQAIMYINYTIFPGISSQTIFGLEVTTGGSGYYYTT